MTAQQTFRNTLVVLGTLMLAYAVVVSARTLVVVLIAIIVASAIRPAVLWLRKRSVPHVLSILLVYGMLALSIFVLFVVVLPPSVTQLVSYLNNDQQVAAGTTPTIKLNSDTISTEIINFKAQIENRLSRVLGTPVTLIKDEDIRTVVVATINEVERSARNPNSLASRLGDAQTSIHDFIYNASKGKINIGLIKQEDIDNAVNKLIDELKVSAPFLAAQVGGFLGDFVLVFVIGVYWLTARDQAVNFTLQLFESGRRVVMSQIIDEIENSMGAYVRGIVLVCTFVGAANFIILTVLGVPNAVTLGFIVGVTTAIPILGGYIGASLAVLLALFSSGSDGLKYALFALVSFVLVQQIENHYLTPRIMSRSVNLNPILIIVFLSVGFAVAGVIGAMIAVPIAGTVIIVLKHLVIEPRQEETAPHLVDGGILLSNKLPPKPAPQEKNPPVPPTNTPMIGTGA